MAHRAFRRGAAAIRSSRETMWIGISMTATILTTPGGTILNALNAAALALRPFTIIRTRMELLVVSDQEVASEVQVGGIGVSVVSNQASAIGVSAVPTPITDIGSRLLLIAAAPLRKALCAIGSSLREQF